MIKFFTAEEGSWRVGRESRKEPAMLATSLSPSKTLKIGTWNIRTMFESGKTAQVAREMYMYIAQFTIKKCTTLWFRDL